MKIIFPEAGNGETSLCLPTLNTVKRIFGGLIKKYYKGVVL